MFHLKKSNIFDSSFDFKRVKRNRTNRVVIAWLLSAVFLLPVVTKTIHVYQNGCGGEACAHSDEHHSNHDSSSCSICQFTFYSFVATDFCQVGVFLTESYYSFFIPDREKGFRSDILFGFLRAPPFM